MYNIYSNDNFYQMYSETVSRLSSDIVSQHLFYLISFERHGGLMPMTTGRFNSSMFNVVVAYFPVNRFKYLNYTIVFGLKKWHTFACIVKFCS